MTDFSLYPHATFRNRMVSMFLDSLLFMLVLSPVILYFSPMFGQDPAISLDTLQHLSQQQTMSDLVHQVSETGVLQHWLVSNAIQLLVIALVAIPFWALFGATPGKMLVRMRIVDAVTRGKPTLLQCIVRFFCCLLSFGGLFIGFFWIIFDKRKRAWHDILAGTEVIIYPKKKWYENPLA